MYTFLHSVGAALKVKSPVDKHLVRSDERPTIMTIFRLQVFFIIKDDHLNFKRKKLSSSMKFIKTVPRRSSTRVSYKSVLHRFREVSDLSRLAWRPSQCDCGDHRVLATNEGRALYRPQVQTLVMEFVTSSLGSVHSSCDPRRGHCGTVARGQALLLGLVSLQTCVFSHTLIIPHPKQHLGALGTGPGPRFGGEGPGRAPTSHRAPRHPAGPAVSVGDVPPGW